ncbi:MAG: hypothetical protein GFH27_549283n384 [Chloroflexi bacterium AL-W]|nr:hypothetical protein [Chloroflexi bacterium AL-N1]NOK64494.1 hypothetical protein [Chloroflexi bacterium AL-N10]NOK75736.1 hypothetical protein [Chloroflexi bacterium AL-N5]NOK80505.1 hypothetical protein [Chloroflexi bacterium AL-W]NOK87019.1 hypothetical protein [Chloroflexi bacterium AL-N15]
MTTQSFGQWLKQLRTSQGLTQHALGYQVGCSGETIRKIETDRMRSSYQIAKRLTQVLNIPARERAHFIQFARTGTHALSLPVPTTPLIGRHQIIAEVGAHLQCANMRLLTLCGPPGVGKTRVALAVAKHMAERFSDGVHFVSLGAIQSPDLVPTSIAQVVGIHEGHTQSLIKHIIAALHKKQLLLILDNFEHVCTAAPVLTTLLASVPQLTLLVTSRSSLHVSGEHIVVVPPLTLPDPANLPDPEQLTGFEAIHLFLQRAQAYMPDFQLTTENAHAVASICTHLDGLPLAIELIAVHTPLLKPQDMVRRLCSANLYLLESGSQDLLPHQQSLHTTLTWSYQLLTPAEQHLFCQLGIFAGTWTIRAAEHICTLAQEHGVQAPYHHSHVPILTRLLHHNLIQRIADQETEYRFRLLETIRMWVLNHLQISGQSAAVHDRHAHYYLHIVEQELQEALCTQQAHALEQLDLEIANLRVALKWSLDSGNHDISLRLVIALTPFWRTKGYLTEGRMWTESVLHHVPATATPDYIRALHAAGSLAYCQGDYTKAQSMLEHCLALAQKLGEPAMIAKGLDGLAIVMSTRGQGSQACQLFEQSLTIHRSVNNKAALAAACTNSGTFLMYEGHLSQAQQLHEESLAIHRELQNVGGIASALGNLGHIAMQQRNLTQATTLHQESLALSRMTGDQLNSAISLSNLGHIAFYEGSYDQAIAFYQESLALREYIGDTISIALSMIDLGWIACMKDHFTESIAYFRQSIHLLCPHESPLIFIKSLEGLAEATAGQGHLARATILQTAAQKLHEGVSVSQDIFNPLLRPGKLTIRLTQLDLHTQMASIERAQKMSFEYLVTYALEDTP